MSEMHEEEIKLLVKSIRVRKAEVEILTQEIDEKRNQVETLLIERGSSWKDDSGYAMLIAAGERVSYDTKALDELILSDPVKYDWLHNYRRKSAVAPSMKIK